MLAVRQGLDWNAGRRAVGDGKAGWRGRLGQRRHGYGIGGGETDRGSPHHYYRQPTPLLQCGWVNDGRDAVSAAAKPDRGGAVFAKTLPRANPAPTAVRQTARTQEPQGLGARRRRMPRPHAGPEAPGDAPSTETFPTPPCNSGVGCLK